MSGANFDNSFMIELALNTNIPLFQEYFSSLQSCFAVLRSGFSINFSTLYALMFLAFKLFIKIEQKIIRNIPKISNICLMYFVLKTPLLFFLFDQLLVCLQKY